MKTKNVVSKKDIIIPKGTIFKCIDGLRTNYCNGNYEASINLSRDNYGDFVIGDDFDKVNFEYIEPTKATQELRDGEDGEIYFTTPNGKKRIKIDQKRLWEFLKFFEKIEGA